MLSLHMDEQVESYGVENLEKSACTNRIGSMDHHFALGEFASPEVRDVVSEHVF